MQKEKNRFLQIIKPDDPLKGYGRAVDAMNFLLGFKDFSLLKKCLFNRLCGNVELRKTDFSVKIKESQNIRKIKRWYTWI